LLGITRVLQFTLPAYEGLKAFSFALANQGHSLIGVALFPEPGAAAAAAAAMAMAGRGTPAFGWGIGINVISVAKAERDLRARAGVGGPCVNGGDEA
jgi:hypothetical protein